MVAFCICENWGMVSKCRVCGIGIFMKKEQQETEVYATALPLSSAVRTGLEPATPCVTGMYSNQLNYRTNFESEISFLFSIWVSSLLRVQSYDVFFIPPNILRKKCDFFEKKSIFERKGHFLQSQIGKIELIDGLCEVNCRIG